MVPNLSDAKQGTHYINDIYFRELDSLYNDNSKKQSLDLSKPPLGHKRTSLQKVLANANKAMERSTKFINKIKSRQLACASRAKSIPENATIRKEYDYWKDPQCKKLKKKYLGDHMPKNKEKGNSCGNNDRIL